MGFSMDAFVNIVLNATSWDQLGLERDKTGFRKAQVRVHPDVCKHSQANLAFTKLESLFYDDRSEERRVGKECRSRWSPYH